MNNQPPTQKQKKKIVHLTTPIRVKKSTARSIRFILTKINKKQLGRKATIDDVVSKAILLLEDSHIEEIKSQTYSSQDQLEIQYQEYCRKNESISKEKFLEILLQAGLPALQSGSLDDL